MVRLHTLFAGLVRTMMVLHRHVVWGGGGPQRIARPRPRFSFWLRSDKYAFTRARHHAVPHAVDLVCSVCPCG